MPLPTNTTQPPDDIFREVDPAKKRSGTKRPARSIQTPPSGPAIPPSTGAALSNRRKYLILIGIVVILFALGGGAYYWLVRTKADATDETKNVNQNTNQNANTGITNQPKNENINTNKSNTNSPPTNSVVVPADADHDGLSDAEEQQLGTNPKASDTDTDGLSDKQEVVLYKSDPKKPDTDGDGINDGAEVQNGYNPAGGGKLYDLNKAINSAP
ncbi:MAG: hypothetical protein WC497_06080 [Patescibacteria group bacterium]